MTKQQLLEAVWPGTYVSDAVLKASIRQLREAMDDDAASPRFIETAHRRGYRFIGPLADQADAVASGSARRALRIPRGWLESWPRPKPRAPFWAARPNSPTLREWVDRGLAGDRQVVFVTGEPGIGKTSLVNGLLQQVSAVARVWIARGQCLEQFGAGEAYLPVLEGLVATRSRA